MLSLFNTCSDLCSCCSLCEEHLDVEVLGEKNLGAGGRRRSEGHLGEGISSSRITWARSFPGGRRSSSRITWARSYMGRRSRSTWAAGDLPPGALGRPEIFLQEHLGEELPGSEV
jgi:hypothetical protein